MFANLYGYVMVYDSYKHHGKYPFDNYKIQCFTAGRGHISILTRGLYVENCKALSTLMVMGRHIAVPHFNCVCVCVCVCVSYIKYISYGKLWYKIVTFVMV